MTTTTRRRGALAALLVLLALLLAACGEASTAAGGTGGSVRVVATTSILGDVVGEALAGTDAEVEVLMAPGVDPHTYAPSARDGVTLREADLVVAVGLGLEQPLVDVLAAAEEDGATVLRVAPLVDPIETGAAVHDHDEEDDHAGGDGQDVGERGLDAHVWLDPIRAGRIAEEVAAAFGAVVPDRAGAASDAAAAYVERMATLDEQLRGMLAALPDDRRRLVTNHDSLGYLAARYDLEVVATVVPGTTTAVDVSAEAFTGLVEVLEQTGVPAVFAETTSSDRLARALAGEVVEVAVVELYTGALGEPGSGADTLEGLLRTDVQRIVDALA